MRTLLLFAFASLTLLGQEAKDYSEAYQEGRRMDLAECHKREQKLLKRPGDLLERTRLIAFYTLSDKVGTSEAIAGRRRHLLWLANEQPESWLWNQRSYGTAVYVSGGRLPDAEGFAQIRQVWLDHLARNGVTQKVRDNAASFLQLGDRETAMRLIRGMRNPRYLGTSCALVLLGVTARDFDTGEPLAADEKVRETPLAQQVMADLEQGTDPQFIGGAGFWLSRDGALLWNRGYTEWDYSSLAKSLLARARALEPNRLDWFFANPELPKPGERRGIGQVRVGGSVMSGKAIRIVKPEVPANLSGIKGTVSLNIAVGHDGSVLKAIPTNGPAALFEISVKAVEQWTYQPTTINGNPVIVLSVVDLNFQ